jgi:perosamine synthetase
LLVEDAAEALGSRYHGRHVGHHGFLSAFSFNGNKIVTTGGGGAIVTSDKSLSERVRNLATTAKIPHTWEFIHDQVGYNYRMPNLNAALGCAQMEKAGRFLSEKRALAEMYLRAFTGTQIEVFREPAGGESNYWLNAVLLPRADLAQRNRLIEGAIEAGFGVRPTWTLMHKLKMFADCPRMDLSVSEDLEARLINLPSSPRLGRKV